MRLREDSEYELLQCDHVVDSLKNINEFTEKDNVLSTEVLVQKLKQLKGKDTLWYGMIAPQYQAIVTS